MKRVAITLAVAAALALTGCSSLHSGVVSGKEHAAAYEYYIMVCAAYGKYGCQAYVPILEHEPERWVLDLKNGSDTGSVDVTERAYNSIKVGDNWTDGTK